MGLFPRLYGLPCAIIYTCDAPWSNCEREMLPPYYTHGLWSIWWGDYNWGFNITYKDAILIQKRKCIEFEHNYVLTAHFFRYYSINIVELHSIRYHQNKLAFCHLQLLHQNKYNSCIQVYPLGLFVYRKFFLCMFDLQNLDKIILFSFLLINKNSIIF